MFRCGAIWLGLLTACTAGGDNSAKGDDTDLPDTDAGETDGVDSDRPAAWSFTPSHPCAGYRTEAMLVHPSGDIWVGCGTNAEGEGLFVSRDDGQTWGPPATNPEDYFRSFRVDDLSLATDGLLYVAGEYTGNGARKDDAVVALDPMQDPSLVLSVFEVGDKAWNSFQVGTYRRLPSGFQVAESLTGSDVVWRASDADEWQNGYGWWPEGESFQILDMEVHGGQLYACGSTIAQPPHVFLPPAEAGEGFHLDPVALADFDGEMWDILADDQGLWVAGVDQDDDVGKAFVSGADLRDPQAWTEIDVGDVISGSSTWLDGLCRRGDTWVMVGRYTQTDDALVLLSEDAGQTWVEATPEDTPALQACQVLLDGRVLVAGGEGTVGWLDPAAR